jgi:hypothetical protein
LKTAKEILYVCMTMDVERIAALSPMGGPPDWDFAERSVRSYCEVLEGFGLKATLFIVPDTAEKQADLFRELADSTGAELGMHMHPQCWRDHYLNPDDHEYLGGYSGADQAQILADGLAQWTDAIGFRPVSFRGGNFSANDETFGVLADLGFTHGSVSQPGRVVTKYRASWPDAVWDVHRSHRAFRCAAGDLDFVEVPLTSDRNRSDHWTGVGDVRIENATAEQIVVAARQEVTRQIEEARPLRHICILTHNFVNYWAVDDKEEGRLAVLKEAVEGFVKMGEQLGLETRGATTLDIRNAYLEAERG